MGDKKNPVHPFLSGYPENFRAPAGTQAGAKHDSYMVVVAKHALVFLRPYLKPLYALSAWWSTLQAVVKMLAPPHKPSPPDEHPTSPVLL